MQALSMHGRHIKANVADFGTTLRALQKSLNRHFDALGKMCDETSFMLTFATTLLGQEQEGVPQQDGHLALMENGCNSV